MMKPDTGSRSSTPASVRAVQQVKVEKKTLALFLHISDPV